MSVLKEYGLLDGENNLTYAKFPLVIDEETFWTDDPNLFRAAGYHHVTHTEMPVREGYYYTSIYHYEGEEIMEEWVEHEEPTPPIDEKTLQYAEAAKILLGEEE